MNVESRLSRECVVGTYSQPPTRRIHVNPSCLTSCTCGFSDWMQVAVGQYHLKINAGDIASHYKFPGQYVQIKVRDADKPGFFAIASPPSDDGILEFLIKVS